jgi:hypothetical protein
MNIGPVPEGGLGGTAAGELVEPAAYAPVTGMPTTRAPIAEAIAARRLGVEIMRYRSFRVCGSRCYGTVFTTFPALTVTGARTVEPMIVGPTWLSTCPRVGPMNERTVKHAVGSAPPVAPTFSALFDPQPETALPPVNG